MGNASRPEFYRLQEKTILNVLYHLRAEIVRESLDGIEHVDALLRARGADPEARAVPQATPRRFRRRALSLAVLRALREGPLTTGEIAVRVGNHPGTRDSVRSALQRLRGRGQVVVMVPGSGRRQQVWAHAAR